jgi:DNA-binding IclR family transcriptional regulator
MTRRTTAKEELAPLGTSPVSERPNLLGTLSNGLAVLDLFDGDHREWSLDELSERTGIRRVNVYRLARTLAYSGYLVYEPSRGKYRLGPAMLRARYLTEDYSQLVFQARPYIEKLARETGETVALIADMDNVPINIDLVRTDRPFLSSFELGYAPGDTAGASGKLFIALKSERDRREILKQPRREWTPKTIVDPEAIVKELEKVRKDGLAVDLEERILGTCGASAPVYNQLGHLVAGVTIIVPTGRFGPQEREHLLSALKAAADSLSRYLGFSGQTGHKG